MKKTKTFPIEIVINDRTCQFNVRKHSTTDGRYTLEYINDNGTLVFQLVRTPIGHWVAGNARIPDWLQNHANEIGRIIAFQNSGKNHQCNK